MISFIIAIDKHFLIGNNNTLPWPHLKTDMQHFRALSMGKTIVMGRKTFQSIGKALPGRKNIVITRDATFSAPDVTVYHSVDDVLEETKNEPEVCIIGGASIYKEFLPFTDTIYLTKIDGVFEGDVYLPREFLNDFVLTKETHHPKDTANPFDLTFTIYSRVTSSL